MPLTKLQFRPGIVQDLTSYSNEGGWRDGDKVRFRLGYPEKIGGWAKYTSSTFLGTCRALHNWIALDGSNYLGLGTNLKYYLEEGGTFNDITPLRTGSPTNPGVVTFSAVTSNPFSSTITVTHTNHGAVAGDFVTFSSAESLGGNMNANVLNQEYSIDQVLSGSSYEITAKNLLGVAVTSNASDTKNGGSGVSTVSLSGSGVAGTGVGTVTVGTAGTGVGAATFSAPSSDGIGVVTTSGVSTGSATHTGVTQTTSTGAGAGAIFTVVTNSGDYTVTITTVGSGYRIGDEVLIEGQNIGGAKETNDLTLTITALAGSSVGSATHSNVAQASTSGSGSGARFQIITDGAGGYSVSTTTVGSNYVVNDTVTIAGTSIGGATPANDLVLTVTKLSGGASASSTETFTGVTQTSTSGSGSSAAFTITTDGSNGTYTVDAITNVGSGYAASNTITIAGTSLGGATPANDLVLTVASVSSQTFTVSQVSTSGSGTGAQFNIVVNGSGAYSLDSVEAIGTGYAVNDTVVIAGASLGGATPANNLTLTVTSLGSPTIASYQINIGLNSTVGGTGWGAGLFGGRTSGPLQTLLNEGGTLSASDTTITVTSTTGIVATDIVMIDNELILVGGVSVSNELTGCTRGYAGSGSSSNVNTSGPGIAATHTDGSLVILAKGNADAADDFSGWGVAASGGLTTTTQIRLWSHDNFGEDLLINPRDSGVFYWDKSTGTGGRAIELSTRSGTKRSVPTICKQIMVSDRDRHVLAFGSDGLGGELDVQGDGVQDPLLIRFSSQENPIDWYPVTTNTAGDLRLGSGSTFVKAIETKREILVWTDTALTSMRFIGPPFTFGLQQLASNITIAGPNAAVATEDFVFWMGADNFYVYAGQTAQLPCTVKDKVFNDINLDQNDKIFGGVNSEFSEVFWFYASAASQVNDRYVVYNYLDKLWYYGTLSRTAWLDRGTRPFPLATEGGYVYNQEFGHDDDGSAMTSYIESAVMDIGDGDHFTCVRRVIPDLSFSGSTAISTPQATFTIKARDFPGEDFANTGAGTTTRTQVSPVEEYTKQLYVRARGRSFALRVESTALGAKWRLGSPRVDIRQDGRR